jgi:hypothetical protein
MQPGEQAAQHAGDEQIRQRLDELLTRLEYLEDIVLSEDPRYAHAGEVLPPERTAAASDAGAGEVLPPERTAAASDAGAGEVLPPEGTAAASDAGAGPGQWLRALQREATADLDQEWQAETGQSNDGPGRSLDLAYVEERLAGRALAFVGGAALILGAVFFLSLAFSRGWINPSMQVTLGLVAGLVGLLVGAVLLRRDERVVGHVLAAVGLAVISLSLFAATELYELVPPAAALGGAFIVAAVTAVVAIATRSQIVAAFGLVTVLAAPPLLGAEPDTITFIYMVAALAGVAIISLWQTWPWLPPLAFVLSAPQVYLWIDTGPPSLVGGAALLLYWALMAVAAGGEAFRRQRQELSLTSAPLLMAAGAFVVFLAFDFFAGTTQLVAFLLVLGALHGAIAAFFVARRGPVDPFGLLVGAYGIGIASMAVPLWFGATLTAVVWSVEAAALAILAGRRGHGPSLIAALVLLVVAGLRLTLQVAETLAEWPYELAPVLGPFDPLVIGLAAFLVAAIVFATVVPDRSVRLTVVGIAVLTCLPVVYLELDGVSSVVAWTMLALIGMGAPRWLALVPEPPISWQMGPALEWLRPQRPTSTDAELLPAVAAALAGLLALGGTIAVTLSQGGMPEVPFSDAAGTSALIVAAGLGIAGFLIGGMTRRWGIIAAGVVMGLAVIFQMPTIWAVVAWSVISVCGFALSALDERGAKSYAVAAAVALGAVAVAGIVYAPPDRLMVSSFGLAPHPPFISEATLVLGVLAIALLAAAWLRRGASWSAAALAAAGGVVLYLISVNIVDLFAAQAYGLPRAELARALELANEAQVALSVLWTVVGVAVIGAGLIFKQSALRIGGLAVLALATVKVFLIDLASLDVAYRVMTLLVLGLLLVISSYAWMRMKPPTPKDPDSPSQDHGINEEPDPAHHTQ